MARSGSAVLFLLGIIWGGVNAVSLSDVTFAATTTEDYGEETLDIGWLEYSSCQEVIGDSPQIYNSEYTQDELIELAQYAVTVKFLPSGDVPGVTETAEYALMAQVCSNPIYALNHGYSMSWTVDETSDPPVITGYSDIDNWTGDSAPDLMWNSCYYSTGGVGYEPTTLEHGDVFQACGNSGGLHVYNETMSSGGPNCYWDWGETTGYDVTIWLGFVADQQRHCQMSDDGTYAVSASSTTIIEELVVGHLTVKELDIEQLRIGGTDTDSEGLLPPPALLPGASVMLPMKDVVIIVLVAMNLLTIVILICVYRKRADVRIKYNPLSIATESEIDVLQKE